MVAGPLGPQRSARLTPPRLAPYLGRRVDFRPAGLLLYTETREWDVSRDSCRFGPSCSPPVAFLRPIGRLREPPTDRRALSAGEERGSSRFERMHVSYRALSFALANTAAVLAALYIAFASDLERPYWAMFTVFVVANPIAGAVRSKAAYRFLGTFAGAVVSLLLVPPLVDEPVLLCVATSLWVGACLYLSLLDRTPRSYAFLLAGYTATIVALAVVDTPQQIFDTTVSRVEEISVGIICAAIAHSVIFPRSIATELNGKIRAALKASSDWLSEALMRPDEPADLRAQQQLATFVTNLHVLYTYVAFETSDVPRAAGVMRALQDRLALLLPRVSGVQKAVKALVTSGAVPPALMEMLAATSRWLRSAESTEALCPCASPRLIPVDLVAATADGLRTPLHWRALLEQSAIVNLRELTAAFADSRLLASALANDGTKLPAYLEREAMARGRRSLHRDRGLALLSAFAAAGATLVACVLWIEGSWPEGAVAAQFAAIGCSVSATLDNPANLIRAAVVAILVALPFAALYEFAILPHIDGFVSLAIVLAPAVLLFSLMQASPSGRLQGAGLVLAVAFSGGLALQSTYRADFAAFVNSNSAEIMGLLVAIAMNLVFRTIDPTWNALRISRAGWKSVSRLATSRKFGLRDWTTQMFDSLGLVTSRMSAADGTGVARTDIDGLRDLRVGLNIGTLRGVEEQLGLGTRSALYGVLETVSGAYASGLGSRSVQAAIERAIDHGIASLRAEAPSRPTLDSLAALTGLRLDLGRAAGQFCGSPYSP